MKRTPVRGVKKNLKLDAYKRSELLYGVTAYLLYNESGSLCMRRAKGFTIRRRSESESE